jgi:hypothetical protein
MHLEVPLYAIKVGLVGFWTLWFFIAFLTNVFDGMKTAGLLSSRWKFASDNFQAVAKATGTYQAPPWVPKLLFGCVILWEACAVGSFGWVLMSAWLTGSLSSGSLNLAFTVSGGLLAGFMLADEVFKQYDRERGHAVLFLAQLVSFACLYLSSA